MRSLAFLGATDPGDVFVPATQSREHPQQAAGMVVSVLGIGGQWAHEDDGKGPVLQREGTCSVRSGDCAEPGVGVATGLTCPHVTTSSSKMHMV